MLRRYRVPVAVATAFAILVGASFLASLSLWRRATVERDRAVVAPAGGGPRTRPRGCQGRRGGAGADRGLNQERAGAQDQGSSASQGGLPQPRRPGPQRLRTQVPHSGATASRRLPSGFAGVGMVLPVAFVPAVDASRRAGGSRMRRRPGHQPERRSHRYRRMRRDREDVQPRDRLADRGIQRGIPAR